MMVSEPSVREDNHNWKRQNPKLGEQAHPTPQDHEQECNRRSIIPVQRPRDNLRTPHETGDLYLQSIHSSADHFEFELLRTRNV